MENELEERDGVDWLMDGETIRHQEEVSNEEEEIWENKGGRKTTSVGAYTNEEEGGMPKEQSGQAQVVAHRCWRRMQTGKNMRKRRK